MPHRRRVVPFVAALAASLLGIAGHPMPDAAAQSSGSLPNAKWISVVLASEPDTLDGCQALRSSAGPVIMQNVVETLTDVDPKTGVIQPRLATAWQAIDDKTWRFTLRQGVTFHDGAPFNAASTMKALQRTLTKELNCQAYVRSFSSVQIATKAIDDYTLEFTSNQPLPILPLQMSTLTVTSPNTPMDKMSLEPIGTGPYAFDGWAAGSEIKLKRNDKYWGKVPPVEGVRYVWRAESAVRAAMVRIGEADISPNIAVQDAKEPAMDYSFLNSETTFMRIDTSRKPLDDIRVRRALNYAFDRHTVRGSILSKDIVHATQAVVPTMAGHNHDLDKRVMPYDPAKARQLLAEAKAAGTPVDNEIVILGVPALYPNAAETVEAMHAMYKAVGFNVRLRNIDRSESRNLTVKPFAEDRVPVLFQSSHDNDKGDPVFSAFTRFACDGVQSMSCLPELDKLIADATVMAGEKRIKAWENVFRIVYDDLVPWVFMYHMVGYSRVGTRVNFTPTSSTNTQVEIATVSFK